MQLGRHGSNHDFSLARQGSGISTTYNVSSSGESIVDADLLSNIKYTASVTSLVDIFTKGIQWHVLDAPLDPIEIRFDILDL